MQALQRSLAQLAQITSLLTEVCPLYYLVSFKVEMMRFKTIINACSQSLDIRNQSFL